MCSRTIKEHSFCFSFVINLRLLDLIQGHLSVLIFRRVVPILYQHVLKKILASFPGAGLVQCLHVKIIPLRPPLAALIAKSQTLLSTIQQEKEQRALQTGRNNKTKAQMRQEKALSHIPSKFAEFLLYLHCSLKSVQRSQTAACQPWKNNYL